MTKSTDTGACAEIKRFDERLTKLEADFQKIAIRHYSAVTQTLEAHITQLEARLSKMRPQYGSRIHPSCVFPNVVWN
jgi:hypothetical protein